MGKVTNNTIWRWQIDGFLERELELSLNQKTCIRPINQGIEFVGYRLWFNRVVLRKSTTLGIKRSLNEVREQYHDYEMTLEEVTQTFNSWDFMAIHPDATVREKHAASVEDACANDNIGYGQSDRNTLNTCAKAVAYVLSKIATKCNCDCSSLQNVCAVASGASGVTYGSNGWTTSTMKAALTAAGYKIITDSAYLTSSAYCVRGAIYVKAGSHTVCGLTNGSKASQTLAKAGISTSSSNSAATSGTKKGYTGTYPALPPRGYYKQGDGITTLTNYPTQIKRVQQLVNWINGGSIAVDGKYGSNTVSAVKTAQKALGVTADGQFGSKTLAAAKTYKK